MFHPKIFSHSTTKNNWTQIEGSMIQVSCAGKHVWAVNGSGQVFRRKKAKWIQIPFDKKMKQISCAKDGSVWGVSTGNSVYRFSNNIWTQISAKDMHQIECGSNFHVWGISTYNQVVKYSDEIFKPVPGSSGFTSISVGSDGEVMGVKNSKLFRWDRKNKEWDQFPDCGNNFSQISVSEYNNIIGITSNGTILLWLEQDWQQVPENKLSQVSHSSLKKIWGVHNQTVYCSFLTEKKNFDWKSLDTPSQFFHVACGERYVWGINKNFEVFRYFLFFFVEICCGVVEICRGVVKICRRVPEM